MTAFIYPDLHVLATSLLLIALLIAIIVLSQILLTYSNAYLAAPLEIHVFIQCVEESVQENESYDKDVSKIPRLEDKLRLGKLLREIQKGGDDLREDLNRLLVEGSESRIRASTRVLWAVRKKMLEERVRRLDMLRMRFLVVYMGLVASNSPSQPPTPSEKSHWPRTPIRPVPQHAMTERIERIERAAAEKEDTGKRMMPPMRRLTTQGIGEREGGGEGRKLGWLGVIQELQKSPLMHRRHASIENSLAEEVK